MILNDFRGPGAHFGDLGAHFEDISDFSDFGDVPGAKGGGTFEVPFSTTNPLFAVLFFDVFLSAQFS